MNFTTFEQFRNSDDCHQILCQECDFQAGPVDDNVTKAFLIYLLRKINSLEGQSQEANQQVTVSQR